MYLSIHLFVYLFIPLLTWIPILLSGLQSITIFVYFAAQIVPDLASEGPFKLAPVSFQYVFIML